MARTRACYGSAGSSGRTGNAKKKELHSTAAWNHFLKIAKYEINDPYRGITQFNSSDDSPWRFCQEVSPQHGEDKVALVCHSSCPSLRTWTSESDVLRAREQRKRKQSTAARRREMLGRRREGLSCICDSNPFCLVSVGGAMDDFLEAAAQKVIPVVDTDDSTSSSPDLPGDEADCTEIIFIDEVKPQRKRIKSSEVVDISDTESRESDLTQEDLRSKQPTAYADDLKKGNSTPKMKLKIPLDKLADVYTMELLADEDELDPEKADSLYAKGTQEELNTLRKVMIIDIGSIISYVDSVVKHHGSMTTLEYINRVQEWHDAMVFSNPQQQTIRPAKDKLTFAMPPGMKNLGATCYLNTQLQCLARNTVFVEGIFSWRPSNQAKNRIENMMEKLQLLLARMVHGAQHLISTEELSQALGLENDEMQDPNEFARLLFDRMHESFQQCSKVSKEQETLGNLLPSLFEGTMTYQTTCLKCRQTKQRHEKFMDLNLPIVQRSRTTGQQRLTELFEATKDTDVQFCLDRYLCPEELTGDNQYLCNTCDSKQDATRQVVFSELPPVLNLQLCRYVFDREKHVKQKLTHGVLLNRTLEVQTRDERKSATYILCAVMIHRGNSAYQGHYVAEAMDWQTGKWFEFNDDLVKILEKGPSCSVGNVEENYGKMKGKVKKGSKDAYNMYYVRQSFLAKSAASSIESEFWSESQPGNAKQNQISKLSVLSQISSERAHLYSLLSDLCLNDGKVADRLRRRRLGLASLLVGCFDPRETGDIALQLVKDQSNNVWTDGKAFRTFLCGQDSESMLSSSIFPQLCEHKVGLHPRVARTGKVLPLTLFNGYVSLQREEHIFTDKSTDSLEPAAMNKATTLFVKDVACKKCCVAYQTEIQAKLDRLTHLKDLYDELDPKREIEMDENDYVFAISGKFITKFRNLVNELLKKLDCQETALEGLESIDISAFLVNSTMANQNDTKCIEESAVNSDISCMYGRCCITLNKRAMRFVSWTTWLTLRAVFPNAVELKIPRGKMSELAPCDLCAGANLEKEKMQEWASNLVADLPRSLVEGKKRNDSVLMPFIRNADEEKPIEGFFLVSMKDMKRWRDAVALAAGGRGNEDFTRIPDRLQEILFPSASTDSELRTHHRTDDFEQMLAHWKPTSLICCEHKRCFFDILFEGSSEGGTSIHRLTKHSEALSAEDYFTVVKSIGKLYSAVCCNKIENAQDDEDSFYRLCHLLEQNFHPRLSFVGAADDKINEGAFVQYGTGNLFSLMKLCPARCTAACCSDLRAETKFAKKIESKESVLQVEVLDVNMDPGVQVGHNISIRVCAVKSVDDIDTLLSTMDDFPGCTEDAFTTDLFRRRSGRKRRQRFSVGVVEKDDVISVLLSHNFAALRLFLFEKCPGFRVDHQLILVFPTLKEALRSACDDKVETERKDGIQSLSRPLSIPIPYEWNTKLLSEALELATKDMSLSEPEKVAGLKELVLIRPSGDKFEGRRKTTTSEPQISNEVLMESLLESANLSISADTSRNGMANGKGNSVRRPERGFRGTLLSNLSEVDEANTEGVIERNRSELTSAHDEAHAHRPIECESIWLDDEDDTGIANHDDVTHSSVSNESKETPETTKDSAVNTDDVSEQQEGTYHPHFEDIMGAVLSSLSGSGIDIDMEMVNEAIIWARSTNPLTESVRDIADAAFAKCMQHC